MSLCIENGPTIFDLQKKMPCVGNIKDTTPNLKQAIN
jgi:hypothetical protein